MKNLIKITLVLALISVIFHAPINAQETNRFDEAILNAAQRLRMYDLEEILGDKNYSIVEINVNPTDGEKSAFEYALALEHYLIAEYILTADKIKTLTIYVKYLYKASSLNNSSSYSHNTRNFVYETDDMYANIQKLKKDLETERDENKRIILETNLQTAVKDFKNKSRKHEELSNMLNLVQNEIYELKERQEEILPEWVNKYHSR